MRRILIVKPISIYIYIRVLTYHLQTHDAFDFAFAHVWPLVFVYFDIGYKNEMCCQIIELYLSLSQMLFSVACVNEGVKVKLCLNVCFIRLA